MLVAPFVDTSGTTALLPRVRETLDAIIEMVVSDQYSGMRTHWLRQGKGGEGLFTCFPTWLMMTIDRRVCLSPRA